MERIDRRRFIGTSSKLMGAAALGGLLTGCADQNEPQEGRLPQQTAAGAAAVPWRYGICNEIMEGWDWRRQCEYAAQVGYEGLEVAPFTLADHVDELSKADRAELREIAEEAGVEVLGLHWLLVTPDWLHVTTSDQDVWQRSWDYMVKLAELCADLGGEVMIFGSPAQRSSTGGLTTAQAVDNLTRGLEMVAPAIGEYDVKLLLEPLSSDQTDVINTVGDAVEVVRAVDHPAVSAMFDFHNTADETEPMHEVIREYYSYLEHIQIQEMDGSYLGDEGEIEHFDEYVEALRAFRELGYDKWVSLEVFEFEPGPETIATESMEALDRLVAAM